MDPSEVTTRLLDNFGNVVMAFGLMYAGVRWLWGRIRTEIRSSNKSVVDELKGVRSDLSAISDMQHEDRARLNAVEGDVRELRGKMEAFATALSGALSLKEKT